MQDSFRELIKLLLHEIVVDDFELTSYHSYPKVLIKIKIFLPRPYKQALNILLY